MRQHPRRPAMMAALQRRCACGGAKAEEAGHCAACAAGEDSARLSRRAAQDATAPSFAPPVVHEVLRAPGRPLDPAPRAAMQERFGYDFSRVRIHDDALAARSAEAVGAEAWTVGRDIAFARGRYAPGTEAGEQLLAHELAHVAQQRSAAAATGAPIPIAPAGDALEREAEGRARAAADPATPVRAAPVGVRRAQAPLLQRKDPKCTSANVPCATADRCAQPDQPGSGTAQGGSDFYLLVHIDVEASDWEGALRRQDFGHTHVEFIDGSDRRYTYGFYPARDLPNENRRQVPGCVKHPDTTHADCVDETVAYRLDQARFTTALAHAQTVCGRPGSYGQTYTCTTFAEQVAAAAGQMLPSSRSAPTSVYYQQVPPIDNPNTLLENVREARQADPNRRQPFWNDPCVNACEAQFDRCLATSRAGPMQCIARRSACFRYCPSPGARGGGGGGAP